MTENTAIIKIIDEITACRNITLEQLHMLLETDDMQAVDYLRKRASEKAHETYGNQVFIRGLIEFTNYCKNDCLYCGIRHSNTHADRYRLSTEQIMACCESGYELGFRTFVLQGGEDPYYTDERICEIVSGIKSCQMYPDCAFTVWRMLRMPYRYWMNGILMSMTGSMLGRPLSALYLSITRS